MAEAWKCGTTVHTAESGEVLRDDPDDPMRRALRQIVGVFAELDRAMTVKRLRDGRRAKSDGISRGYCAAEVDVRHFPRLRIPRVRGLGISREVASGRDLARLLRMQLLH